MGRPVIERLLKVGPLKNDSSTDAPSTASAQEQKSPELFHLTGELQITKKY